MNGLVVTTDLVIPEGELEWRFSTTGGPGGQHANRTASRAMLRWNVGTSGALDEAMRTRILDALVTRLEGDTLEVTVDETRSQWRNRRIARSRLATLVRDALRPASPPRRPTRPSARIRRERVRRKRKRGETKRLRKPPEPD